MFTGRQPRGPEHQHMQSLQFIIKDCNASCFANIDYELKSMCVLPRFHIISNSYCTVCNSRLNYDAYNRAVYM